jgi:hypothetical protein
MRYCPNNVECCKGIGCNDLCDKLNEPWFKELVKVNQCPQRQDSAHDQLSDLIIIANKFGFYDAADFLKVMAE